MMFGTIAVIPSFAIYGPIALLALLVPAAFGGLTLWLKRWSCSLMALSLSSALSLAFAMSGSSAEPSPFVNRMVPWLILSALLAAFAMLSAARNRIARSAPTRGDGAFLFAAALIAAGFALWSVERGGRPGSFPALEMTVIGSASAAAFLTIQIARCIGRTLPPAESVWLAALSVGCVAAVAINLFPFDVRTGGRLLWASAPLDAGMLGGTSAVSGESIIVTAAHSAGLQAHGAVYCLSRADGRLLWRFTDDSRLKPVYSSPCISEGRVCFGDGLHSDRDCKLYCLDAETGAKQWEFATHSHVESGPVVASGLVIFGAGDDGVYALDSTNGKLRWQFPGLHVDANPLVAAGRVFAGSTRAAGPASPSAELFSLDAADGRPIWRVAIDLSSFGRPAMLDGAVYFGLHSGDLETRADPPAGAVISLDSTNGTRIWRTDLPDAVFTGPLVDAEMVVVGCRDGYVYSLNRADGAIRWRTAMGSPVLASPAGRFVQGRLSAIYAAGRDGLLARLDPATGEIRWSVEVRSDFRTALLAAPLVVQESAQRRVYVCAGSVGFPGQSRVFCYSDDD